MAFSLPAAYKPDSEASSQSDRLGMYLSEREKEQVELNKVSDANTKKKRQNLIFDGNMWKE